MAVFRKTIWSSIKKLFVVDDARPTTHDYSGRKEETLGFAPPRSENKTGLISRLAKLYNYRVELEMKEWKIAVALAEDDLRPRREELYRLYHRALEDDHLLSQIRTARFTVQTGDFYLHHGDKTPDEDLKELFTRPWFYDFIEYAVDTEMHGHSLLEFNPAKKDGEFTSIDLIPRLHVRPEYGEVVINLHDESGIAYREGSIGKYILELGRPYDLGLLKVASKSVIRKEYALADWSRRNEKYGMPWLVVRTSSRQKEELDEKQRMAENFGNNAWAILDDQDQIDMLESNQAFAFQSFENYADRVDRAISILINGQTGTTEEKAHVGSAEVHERILNNYTKARMRRIQDWINYKLIPFLATHGYPLVDTQFQFIDLEDKPKTEKQDKPDNMDKGDEQELSIKKKSLAA
jgi:phage gp29-like protein